MATTTQAQLSLTAPVTSLPRVGPSVTSKMERLEIRSVRDLLTHWPRTWRDMSQLTPFKQLRADQFALVRGTIHSIALERRRGKRLVRVTAVLRDEEGHEFPVLWFNQAYLATSLRDGQPVLLAGTVKWDWYRKQLYLASPTRETGLGVLPVYPETDGINSRFLRSLITPLLPTLSLADPVNQPDVLPLTQAVKAIHQPVSIAEAQAARARLALDEHLLLQLGLASRRAERLQHSSPVITPSVTALRSLVAGLPFTLTAGQRKAAWQLIQRLETSHPTHQLLQGDVGSGKSVVALLVALSVLEAGYDVTWMVPTQVLARQMTERLTKLLSGSNYRPTLVMQGEALPTLSTDAQLFVGTHALLGLDRPKIGLAIVDEQQRFGVGQRDQVATSEQVDQPHVLTMTATPIPRSLALAVLGEDELVTLTDRPHHQQPVRTNRISDRSEAFTALAQALAANQQAFVVVPRIEDQAEKLFTQSIESVASAYRTAFPDASVGVLHGRQDSATQTTLLEQFQTGTMQILVATTVVEVGVDVPNATIMIIEEADRFGLAQLHQLRGRVGRGIHAGQCFAVSGLKDELGDARLMAFVSTNDGFVIAAHDLRLRGPGELLGTIQSGLPQLKLAALDDTLQATQARAITSTWVAAPPPNLTEWLAFYRMELRGDGELVRIDP